MAGESIIWIVFSAPKYDRCFVITGSPLAGSAINATLFSSAHFAEGLLSDDLLPDQTGNADGDGIPQQTVLLLGGITAAFTWYGSLGAITSFYR